MPDLLPLARRVTLGATAAAIAAGLVIAPAPAPALSEPPRSALAAAVGGSR